MDSKKRLKLYQEYIIQCTTSPGSWSNYSQFGRIDKIIKALHPNYKDLIEYDDALFVEKLYNELLGLSVLPTESGLFKDLGNGQYKNAMLCYIKFLKAVELLKNISTTKVDLSHEISSLPLQQIFYGAPGTGKSNKVNETTRNMPDENVFRTTFHPDSDYASFVGCYKPTAVKESSAKQTILDYNTLVDRYKDLLAVPTSNVNQASTLMGYKYHDSIVQMQNNGHSIAQLVKDAYKSNTTYDTVVRNGMACFEENLTIESQMNQITYKFVPQVFTKAYVQAWKNWAKSIKTVSLASGSTCPNGNNQSPYSPISKTGTRTFDAEYRNGATLTKKEMDYLSMIENFQFPFGKNSLFGELRDDLTVVVTDKPTLDQIESRKITFTKQMLEELKKRVKDYIETQGIEFNQLLGSLLEKIEALLRNAENGSVTYSPTLLGMYCPSEKAIYLFKDNIGNSLSKLVSTYVHEMFHAYYAAPNYIPEIEEPIVEASMLSFLEMCSKADGSLSGIFSDAIYFVNTKKFSLGIGHYGFGYDLYQNQSLDWMGQYKGNRFDANSILVTQYKSKFDMIYPFGEEKETMQLLWDILNGVEVASVEADPVMLVIEEINRGNCAQIFGDIFQLLDRKDGFSEYPIKPDSDLGSYLKDEFKVCNIPEDVKEGRVMMLPKNLYIWATMNTSDQSLFPIDSAFKRRWDWKYMPINTKAKEGWMIDVNGSKYSWSDFLEKINTEIEETTSSEDKQLGFFFCKASDDGVISAEKFVSKVLFYLYNDVFKDFGLEREFLKYKDGDKKGKTITFRSFFEANGDIKEQQVELILENLGLDPIVGTTDNKDNNKVPDTKKPTKVTFPDGDVIEEGNGWETYVAALKKIGLEKAFENNNNYRKGGTMPLISDEKKPDQGVYKYVEVDGYYVLKGTDSQESVLKHLSEVLDLGLIIE